MRKIQNIAFVLLATLFASCINDHIEPSFCRDGELSISVSTSSAGTRVQGANDDIPTAESIVKDLQYFLYVKGSGDKAAPIYAGTITDITDNDDYDDNERPKDEDDNFSKNVQIPASALNQLFLNGATECEIYVIANYLDNGGDDLTKNLENATRENLKAIELNTTFYGLFGDVEITPSSFVMDSKGTDIVSRGTGNAINTLTSGTIYLTRAAAKVMIEVNVQNAIDVSGNTWEPITQITDPTARKMFISFYNGVTTGVIDDGTDESGSTAVTTVADKNAYYMVENVQLQEGKASVGGATGDTSAVTRADESTSTSWVPALDFYSYANSWTAGDEEHEPYFEISIPWRKQATGQDDSANWVTYTYTVPIAMNDNRFDRNKLYLIRLNVGALGDLSTLESYEYSYIVLNWDEKTVNATLTRPKYFVVEEEYVEVYNKDSYAIGYYSSDAVSAVITSITKPNYSSAQASTTTIYSDDTGTDLVTPTSGNRNPFRVSVVDGEIVFAHTLVNDRSNEEEFDFVPYTIKLRVESAIGLTEEIEIIQYPAMYIQGSLNPGYGVSSSRGYVFVNGNTQTNTSWNVVAGSLNTGTSNSPYMYIITVTSFADNQYTIGDPRVTHFDNPDYSFTSAPSTSGASPRTLSYYYPTRSSEDYENIIAPRFRICSGYGRLNQGTVDNLDEAERRCASYQEAGYPAGRWRLPTRAELQYVGQLCAEGKIPTLFSNKSYWAASTAFTYSDSRGTFTETNSADVVRCVYDDWYWGSDPVVSNTTFTWGDELRPGDSAN